MAIKAVETPKPLGQTYYEEVEALKAQGMSNADAVQEVAKKHGKNQNAVRGGIHQYRTRHLGGSGTTRRGRRSGANSVEDYVSTARKALEAARDLIDREVEQAKAELDAAQKRYDEAVASVKERKTDIEKKLRALA
jgi:predicted  nucleic acid-binding Zn-ribbon protein